jgi:hypothetical protein
MERECRLWRGRIRLARGQLGGALEDARRALILARESGDRQNLDPALAFGTRVLLAAGREADAGKLLDELLATLGGGLLKPALGVDLAVGLVALGRPVEALDTVQPSPWLEAARAFVVGDALQAADSYARIGSRPDEVWARLHGARQLMVAGRPAEAGAQLEPVLAFYREVGASTYLAEATALTPPRRRSLRLLAAVQNSSCPSDAVGHSEQSDVAGVRQQPELLPPTQLVSSTTAVLTLSTFGATRGLLVAGRPLGVLL